MLFDRGDPLRQLHCEGIAWGDLDFRAASGPPVPGSARHKDWSDGKDVLGSWPPPRRTLQQAHGLRQCHITKTNCGEKVENNIYILSHTRRHC